MKKFLPTSISDFISHVTIGLLVFFVGLVSKHLMTFFEYIFMHFGTLIGEILTVAAAAVILYYAGIVFNWLLAATDKHLGFVVTFAKAKEPVVPVEEPTV